MPSTQKALLFEKEEIKPSLKTVSVPKPGAGQLLVKIKAVSLNPIDYKAPKWEGYIEQFPAVLGLDIAGDVEEVGDGVSDFKKGDRVVVQGSYRNDYAGFQQYTLGNAASTAKIPSNVSYDQASTLPVVLSAAYTALYNKHPHGLGFTPPTSPESWGQYSGTPIVVFGGAGSVGQITIQLAKLSGFSPIITTASLNHADSLKTLGATHVLDRNLDSAHLRSEIKKITNDAPIKTIVDGVSLEATQQAAFDLLSPGGQMVVFLDPFHQSTGDKNVIYAVGVATLHQNIKLFQTLYHDYLEGFLKEGVLKPNRVEVLPDGLEGIDEGLTRLSAHKVSRSKLVAHPQETA
ncbi:GroES-like protein [Phlegmacium glaucopus]|nr:GroES-like protein [Phlegmacium glaucopus]